MEANNLMLKMAFNNLTCSCNSNINICFNLICNNNGWLSNNNKMDLYHFNTNFNKIPGIYNYKIII